MDRVQARNVNHEGYAEPLKKGNTTSFMRRYSPRSPNRPPVKEWLHKHYAKHTDAEANKS